MSHLVSQNSSGPNDSIKNVLSHMSINSRQRIVQQVNIWLPVNCSSKTHPLLLTSGQVQALRSTHQVNDDQHIQSNNKQSAGLFTSINCPLHRPWAPRAAQVPHGWVWSVKGGCGQWWVGVVSDGWLWSVKVPSPQSRCRPLPAGGPGPAGERRPPEHDGTSSPSSLHQTGCCPSGRRSGPRPAGGRSPLTPDPHSDNQCYFSKQCFISSCDDVICRLHPNSDVTLNITGDKMFLMFLNQLWNKKCKTLEELCSRQS